MNYYEFLDKILKESNQIYFLANNLRSIDENISIVNELEDFDLIKKSESNHQLYNITIYGKMFVIYLLLKDKREIPEEYFNKNKEWFDERKISSEAFKRYKYELEQIGVIKNNKIVKNMLETDYNQKYITFNQVYNTNNNINNSTGKEGFNSTIVNSGSNNSLDNNIDKNSSKFKFNFLENLKSIFGLE